MVQITGGARASDRARVGGGNGRPHTAIHAGGYFHIRAYDREGRLKFQELNRPNLVFNEGLNLIRYAALLATAGGVPARAWYLGLTASSPTFAAADTATSHAGWAEATTYSEANLQQWNGATTAVGEASSTASVASYSINGSDTFGGVFMKDVNTKGSATAGPTMYSGVAFSSNRSLASGDTLTVAYTHSFADAT